MPVATSLCVCVTMIPDNALGAKGTKALAPVLGHLTQLMKLYLNGEYDKVFQGRVW